tara:strand:+ start:782 stop:1261 length:480 start_codon:yes stop_codon:yes gene_type:complete
MTTLTRSLESNAIPTTSSQIYNMPVTTLKNGLIVGNFSSPHDFNFDTGETLKSCDPERSERLKVDFIPNISKQNIRGIEIKNNSLSFGLSPELKKEVYHILALSIANDPIIPDIILIPLPMIQAIKKDISELDISKTPFRGIKMKSRTEKLTLSQEFCI